jgi:hypothetical protein
LRPGNASWTMAHEAGDDHRQGCLGQIAGA